MTNPFYGSSLFQTRKTDHAHHRHSHLHPRNVNHLRSHSDFHRRQEENETADLDPGDSVITEVVQTISVVQVIDESGAVIEAHTLLPDPQTGSNADPHVKAVSIATGPAGAATVLPTQTETAISSVGPVSASLETTSPSASPSDVPVTATTYVSQESSGISTSLAPTLSSSISLTFPTASSNSTLSSFSSSSLLSTSSTHSNVTVTTGTSVGSSTASQSLPTLVTTLSSSFSESTSLTVTPLSSFTSSLSSVTESSSVASSTSSTSASSLAPSSTSDLGPGDSPTPTAVFATPSSFPTVTPSASPGDDSAPPTGTVVGGVVGGVAGLALLIAFVFMILRLRKRGWCHLRLRDDSSTTPATRAVVGGPSGEGSGGSGAYGTMKRRSTPYSVASSLAALAGKRSSRERSNTGSEMAERGFVRVSGKKLPPVLQFGGDGYTDPRDRSSVNSDASVYRGSMAILNQPSHQRLALGSPMRPESGVMVMNPGPAKMPTTGEVPKSIDSPTLPRSSVIPSVDAIGRTLAAQDHSRDGAASRESQRSARFVEQLP